MIKVAEMVQQMRILGAGGKPRPFHIVYCTADRQRQTGGEIRELHKATLLTPKRQSDRLLNFQPLGSKDIVRVHLDLILYFNNQEVV